MFWFRVLFGCAARVERFRVDHSGLVEDLFNVLCLEPLCLYVCTLQWFPCSEFAFVMLFISCVVVFVCLFDCVFVCLFVLAVCLLARLLPFTQETVWVRFKGEEEKRCVVDDNLREPRKRESTGKRSQLSILELSSTDANDIDIDVAEGCCGSTARGWPSGIRRQGHSV